MASILAVLEAAFVDDTYRFEATVWMGSNASTSSTILHWRKLKRPDITHDKKGAQRRTMLAVVPQRTGWKAIADLTWIEVFDYLYYCLHKISCLRSPFIWRAEHAEEVFLGMCSDFETKTG
jgi:hypothetical protein